MLSNCQKLHVWANSLKIFEFPFDEKSIPQNGIYFLFQKGEKAHNANRIVRIGTHTGQNQLPPRLRQHFLTENKDRSIFRKNIGRAILNKVGDTYLDIWELDLTSKESRARFLKLVDANKQKAIERQVSGFIQQNFSFAVIGIEEKEKRLSLESKIISTVSWCKECTPSTAWLGLKSPKKKIRESGLWLVNELFKTPLSDSETNYLIGM